MKKKMILVAIVAVLSKHSMADDVIVFNSPMPMKTVYGDPGHGEDRIENGKIVVDSPFDLEIGSAEYSKVLGKAIKSHKDVRKDPKTGATTTNWYHFAEARFSQPYFGAERAWLSFDGEDKKLSNVHLSVGENKKGFGGKLTFTDCCKKFDEIAADMSKRLGEEFGDEEATEEEVLENLAICTKDSPGSHGHAVSFRSAVATVARKYGDVEYHLSAMIHGDKTYSVSLSFARPFRQRLAFAEVCDERDKRIPVYTNKPHSVDFSLRTPEQEKAHREADALRATIKRLFDVDLDAPSETNDTSAALMALTNSPARPEWFPLARPFAGCTERKVDRGLRLMFIPMVNFGIRHPFDGDVGEEELKAESQRILEALERELGAKIPAFERSEKKSEIVEPPDSAPPALGDLRAMLRSNDGVFFMGGIGDICITVKYAVPSYVKRGGQYCIAQRGAVVVEIMQSQIVAGTRKAAGKQQRKGGR